MADPAKEFPFEAGGKSFVLYYGNRALRMIEVQSGRPLGELLSAYMGMIGTEDAIDLAKVNIEDLTTLFWAGLQQHQPGTALEAVDDIIDDMGFAQAIGKMSEALAAAFPAPEGESPQGNANRALRRARSNGTGRVTSGPRS